MPLDLQEALIRGAESLGVPMSAEQSKTLLSYQALLLKWNQVYNLTAVREPAEVLTHHLLDSLAVLPGLRRYLIKKPKPRLLDVGSGGGLPGVVLAILWPTLEVTCVDAVHKKVSFIRQVAAELKLPHLQAIHARVEAMPAESFDVIASRAFSSLGDFVRLTRQLLAPHGVWMAMKGRSPTEEMQDLPSECEMFHVEQLTIPGLDAERCVVWMRPRP